MTSHLGFSHYTHLFGRNVFLFAIFSASNPFKCFQHIRRSEQKCGDFEQTHWRRMPRQRAKFRSVFFRLRFWCSFEADLHFVVFQFWAIHIRSCMLQSSQKFKPLHLASLFKLIHFESYNSKKWITGNQHYTHWHWCYWIHKFVNKRLIE